jgi:hypothetical protein
MTLFSLEKTLALLVMPAGLIWLLILAAALLCLRRRQRAPAGLCLGIAVLYACAGSPYLGRALMGSLERRVAPVSLAALEPFDAVFVLGGGSEQDPAGDPELGPSGDRVFLAARLWHAGKARLLVTSGAARDGVSGTRARKPGPCGGPWASPTAPSSRCRNRAGTPGTRSRPTPGSRPGTDGGAWPW